MRLVIFMTGQFRSFWRAYANMMEKVVVPAERVKYDVVLCIGLDRGMKTKGVRWEDGEMEREREAIKKDWLMSSNSNEKKTSRGFIMEWIDKSHPDFQKAEKSLEWFQKKGSLASYWMDYLLNRSGSCIEYAQFNALMERCREEYSPFSSTDFLLRTRTDILLRYEMDFTSLSIHQPPEHIRDVFPGMMKHLKEEEKEEIDWKRNHEREASILQWTEPSSDSKWAITFRKNLIYIMPLTHATIVCGVVQNYGNWDTPQENRYWFNAESQFRGCLRNHGFNVLEYSQDVDECHDELEFEDSSHRLPLYAIMRAI